jgi:ubiquinone/menaquinone biosynthesis C-methylase UbiE
LQSLVLQEIVIVVKFNKTNYKITVFVILCSSRMMDIQGEMAERAIELLELPENEPQMILDLGCGSGLSGAALDESGHMWVGLDISESMLSKSVGTWRIKMGSAPLNY